MVTATYVLEALVVIFADIVQFVDEQVVFLVKEVLRLPYARSKYIRFGFTSGAAFPLLRDKRHLFTNNNLVFYLLKRS